MKSNNCSVGLLHHLHIFLTFQEYFAAMMFANADSVSSLTLFSDQFLLSRAVESPADLERTKKNGSFTREVKEERRGWACGC